ATLQCDDRDDQNGKSGESFGDDDASFSLSWLKDTDTLANLPFERALSVEQLERVFFVTWEGAQNIIFHAGVAGGFTVKVVTRSTEEDQEKENWKFIDFLVPLGE